MKPQPGMPVVVWIGDRAPQVMRIAFVIDDATIGVVNDRAQHWLKVVTTDPNKTRPTTHSWAFAS